LKLNKNNLKEDIIMRSQNFIATKTNLYNSTPREVLYDKQ